MVLLLCMDIYTHIYTEGSVYHMNITKYSAYDIQ